ncbi:MAG TPA: hypothetical protein VIJ52_05105 [Pseudolabrys sp.]
MTARRFLHGSIAGLMALVWSGVAIAGKKPPGFPGSYANELGTVTIKQTADGFDIDISAAAPSGKWVCDFSESGKLNNDGDIVIHYKADPPLQDENDEVTLSLKKNMLSVTEFRGKDGSGMIDFCGYNGRIEGNYRRKARR